ncbi:MAG: hypothetical protein U5R49_20230 [Deltaproteobacteria bacterium]|nr:hypothetical protein [Deltaproteobacteria bacterium]
MGSSTKHYGNKHPGERQPNPEIQKALTERLPKGELPCAVAFDIAAHLNVSPGDVGVNADLMEIPLVKCQLGLFGYQPEKRIVKPADTVSETLKAAIEKGLENDRLPCASAWGVAKELGVRKMEVSAACEALGIKIGPCQLGAF